MVRKKKVRKRKENTTGAVKRSKPKRSKDWSSQ